MLNHREEEVTTVWSDASDFLLRSPAGRDILRTIEDGIPLNINGLVDSAKSFLIASLEEKTERGACVFVPDEARAYSLREELAALIPEESILTFHSRELSLYDIRATNRDREMMRSAVLMRLLRRDFRVLIVPADAALQRVRSPETYRRFVLTLATGQETNPDTLESHLVTVGYERVPQVEQPGQYARRGDIVDVFPPDATHSRYEAIRILFFDIEVDELKAFDPDSQRSTHTIRRVDIPPAREIVMTDKEREATADRLDIAMAEEIARHRRNGVHRDVIEKLQANGFRDLERIKEKMHFPSLDRLLPLIDEEVCTVADFVRVASPLLFLDEPLTFSRRLDAAHAGFIQRLTGLMEKGDTFSFSEGCQVVPPDVLRAIENERRFIALVDIPASGNGLPGAAHMSLHAGAVNRYRNQPDKVAADVAHVLQDRGSALMFAGSDERAEQLSFFLLDRGAETAVVLPGVFPRGFVIDSLPLLVVGTENLYGVSRRKSRRKKRSQREVFYQDLVPGSFVVHEDYGIGCYEGTEPITTSDGTRDYLTIRYRDGVLRLPVDRVDLLSPYIPVGDTKPRLTYMGGAGWQRQKERARSSIKRLVTDIISLYAERESIKGHVYGADTVWQKEFEESFPYEETNDQLRVIAEIKSDMESEKVMDRLICGDVGFGKTEVCFRAMFKCVMEGKQAALLAPTTVLVRQHVRNLRERLGSFPVEVRELSRFIGREEQKTILKELANGHVDIVIATHRLLSKDVSFKDLGLLVIDEEQRFGVDHKEMIKALSPSVEVLTLTATPIPRTLHLSLAGMRDISLLEEGPEDRLPIRTAVIEYDEDLVFDAILRERARHGQVFYLFNNTHKIDQRAAELAEKMPGIRFAVAHGKMTERQLESVIEDFLEGEYDVLVCTTIIESGVDMPRVNTLIVEDADRFGLAQLYQIRGRVGRSERQAYALITYRPDRVIGEAAEKRLAAIRDFTELGSGFQIALRDLEVRGAGNLLGAEQSGHLESIGYDLYTRMLEETVREAKGLEPPPQRVQTVVDLTVDAILSTDYVSESDERLDIYRRIASIDTLDDYRDVFDELTDRYGDPPEETVALLDISYIRAFGERAGLARICSSGRNVELILHDSAKSDERAMELVSRLLSVSTREHRLTFKAGYRAMILADGVAVKSSATPSILRDIFSSAEKV
ncbi:MAG TPA: transcription-repair coupling factor [Bacillota bacterium]|nr:transcription-repair coupling factor [Bacillota bacterium]HQC48997.1 transcription-repair coupling factor [Bacillota bacterium]